MKKMAAQTAAAKMAPSGSLERMVPWAMPNPTISIAIAAPFDTLK
ncbi:hypothetical protein [Azospirillum argentinense]